MRNRLLLLTAVTASAVLYSDLVITNVDSDYPAATKIAPGQILTIRVRGLDTRFPATQVGTTLPLPRDFQGVSVSLRQSDGTGVLLPLIRGNFDGNCDWKAVIPPQNQQTSCNDPDANMFAFRSKFRMNYRPILPGR